MYCDLQYNCNQVITIMRYHVEQVVSRVLMCLRKHNY
jgi:hypothetical protein